MIKNDLTGLITQGSYNTSVGASGNTHAGGGVWDVKHSLVDNDQKKRAWLKWGVVPFDRRTSDADWVNHGHLVVAGCPHLDASAAKQVTAAKNGRNALRSNGVFRGLGGKPSVITWQQALKQNISKDVLDTMTEAQLRKLIREEVNAVLYSAVGDKSAGAYWGTSLMNAAQHGAAHAKRVEEKLTALISAQKS